MASAAWANAFLAGGENIRGIGKSLMDVSLMRERQRREAEERQALTQYRTATQSETQRHNREMETTSRMNAERLAQPTPRTPSYQFRENAAGEYVGLNPLDPTDVVSTGQRAPQRPIGSGGDPLLAQSRVQDMEDQRIDRASRVVQRLADAGQPYGEAALHPEVKGIISPDEVRGIYEGQKRNIAADSTRLANTRQVMENRGADKTDPMEAYIATLIGGEQPTQTPMPSRNPIAAPTAMAAEPAVSQKEAAMSDADLWEYLVHERNYTKEQATQAVRSRKR